MTQERVETGKMQFENDWPGVFIRGDEALGYAAAIRRFLAATEVPRHLSDDETAEWRNCRPELLELAALLESCRVKGKSRG
jgi:hypothetical protein